jgi:hypothetical protein
MDLNRDEAAPIFYYERQARIGLVRTSAVDSTLLGLYVTTARSAGGRRTFDSNVRRFFGIALSHKAMGDPSSIDERAHDLTAIIDPYGFGSRGSR